MSLPSFDFSKSALVLIDLQNGIVGLNTAPRSGKDVVANATQLVKQFRAHKAPIVFVRVAFSADNGDNLAPLTDSPAAAAPKRPADWSDVVSELAPTEGDIIITKRQWGAFFGTELDLQLRRRGINTLVLGGIATNIGVESTARSAYEHGYNQVFIEDAMAAMSAETHDFPLRTLFPRMGRVRSTASFIEETTA